MLLKDLLEVASGHVAIYIGNNLFPIYQGYYCCVPKELLNYKITKIGNSHYYFSPMGNEKVDCLGIGIIKED